MPILRMPGSLIPLPQYVLPFGTLRFFILLTVLFQGLIGIIQFLVLLFPHSFSFWGHHFPGCDFGFTTIFLYLPKIRSHCINFLINITHNTSTNLKVTLTFQDILNGQGARNILHSVKIKAHLVNQSLCAVKQSFIPLASCSF